MINVCLYRRRLHPWVVKPRVDLLKRAVKQPRQAARVDLPLRDMNHGLHDGALSSGLMMKMIWKR